MKEDKIAVIVLDSFIKKMYALGDFNGKKLVFS